MYGANIDIDTNHAAADSTAAADDHKSLMTGAQSEISVNPQQSAAYSRFRYLFGLFLLLLVVLLWVISGVLIQEIFTNFKFSSPFFLTYFSTSLFTMYLVSYFAIDFYRRRFSEYAKYTNIENFMVPSVLDGAAAANQPFSVRKTAQISLILCPIWFGMNYFYNLSLLYTSIASSTILSSTSSLFVLILSYFLLQSRLRIVNVLGVLATIGGAVIISLKDKADSAGNNLDGSYPMRGDLLAGMSAILYGLYTVYLRLRVPDENAVSMQLLLGFLGLFNLIFFWPLFIILHYSDWETFHFPPWRALVALLLNGIFGSVISDFMWAKSVLYTSPLIASLGLTCNIPLAMLADAVLHGKSFGGIYIAGSSMVLAGFVLVNWSYASSEQIEATSPRNIVIDNRHDGRSAESSNNHSNYKGQGEENVGETSRLKQDFASTTAITADSKRLSITGDEGELFTID
jgi:solute carrier family 35 protein F5